MYLEICSKVDSQHISKMCFSCFQKYKIEQQFYIFIKLCKIMTQHVYFINI